MDHFAEVASQYFSFTEDAHDSPCIELWAQEIAGDEEVLAWIAELPRIKQQPNLVFAAARWHGVPAPDACRPAPLSRPL
ncbi:DUF2332 family protein [Arthrobacter sp. ERGS1:01]|uniref:DUF2332 family protein n=1 Tax=Arthrobacter sp. ERGS1:01 TaxID=1704044 RepID=UPI000A436F26